MLPASSFSSSVLLLFPGRKWSDIGPGLDSLIEAQGLPLGRRLSGRFAEVLKSNSDFWGPRSADYPYRRSTVEKTVFFYTPHKINREHALRVRCMCAKRHGAKVERNTCREEATGLRVLFLHASGVNCAISR